MKQSISISIRLAAAMTAGALAACGGGGDPATGTPTSAAGAPAPAAAPPASPAPAPAPAPSAAPAPATAPAPAPGPAPAPAPAAVAGDAVRGKQIYNDLPNTALACVQCHGAPNLNISNILSAAGDWQVISRAITANKGGMGALAFPVLTGYDMQDIAAYLAQPNL
jgi:mono/diheme cytochrome c family protein